MRIESFLKQSPIFQVNRIARKMGASLNQIFEGENLTAVESLILAAIFLEKKTEINPSRLVQTFETSRGNISHCLSSQYLAAAAASGSQPSARRRLINAEITVDPVRDHGLTGLEPHPLAVEADLNLVRLE